MQLFRSRGVKFKLGEYEPHKIKIYYEPNEETLSLNSEVEALMKRFQCLEYASSDGKIDAINFHIDCKNIGDIVSKFNNELIMSIETVFDSSYKPYTIGYRMNGGKSVYIYPTVWKENRFGIRGIIDTKTIYKQINRFLSFIYASSECKNSICEQISYITKFKGICITNHHQITSYKLYYRMSEDGIRRIFIPRYNIEHYREEYGDIALISVGICDGEIDSYNFYFLR